MQGRAEPPDFFLIRDSLQALPDTLSGLIQEYFRTIETKHGVVLVGRALGLLCAARYGLSQEELFDALNTDERVLGAVFQVW